MVSYRVEKQAAPEIDRVMTAVLKDDTELFKQFTDNESFRRWLTDTSFGLTYDRAVQATARNPRPTQGGVA